MLYVAIALAALALVFAFVKFKWIMGQDTGTEAMQIISRRVQEGAAAFLRAEYRWLTVFVIIVAIVIATTLAPKTAIAFVFGAVASGIAGYVGMHTATRAALRTTQAATKSLQEALGVSFSSGIVMGMSVVGLALMGVAIFTWLYTRDGGYTTEALNEVLGFSFGASSIALFARVGGGIFTKAADVGADLVGKVEAGIPEDDPRNPGTIADNVGDNVGDVAGMGADLFESYAGSIIATMILGVATFIGAADASEAGANMVILPLIVAAIGVIGSIIGTFFVKATDEHGLHSALFRGLIVASVVVVAGMAAVCFGELIAFPETLADGSAAPAPANYFYAIVAGLIVGVVVGKITEYYTGSGTKPVTNIAKQSETGAATNIIHGLATGMESVALPLVVICVGIALAYGWAGTYGVAIAAVGMLSTLGISLGVDAYGPVADNAGGLAEMAELPKEVRERTDALDACGNTTAAIGKGFAIGSAALTALALFAAFNETLLASPRVQADPGAYSLAITEVNVLIGLLMGGMLPFVFSAMTMRAVGNAANKMVDEIRRQFREIPGLLEGKAEPDSARCVEISTAGSLRQMIVPGMLAVAAPILMGLWSVQALGGMLAGALVSGVSMAIFMSNAGGAWDNAKKFIETTGAHGGKGSDAHHAAVVGDTVGDPFKDTSGPSLNILVKLMTVVGLVFLPLFLR
ncbi:sodium-translocating pyrophosphatase [Engelhardtia mirabilis]|uniref:Putative K(+)-stimulated pyrophosphate-energized sodium pump n=1 Tax=Engelhardtia mirabilis TaxID=2528011 RepID=A0A518BNV9_9BACT|nr:Putative K(+)-stimulated pyrophosphate-energized sodium pump [Planctomycetes bacterium Pla133]QDV02991.1 Putative K(+)-stimulated pyrophosphate-energized sodium pump [Planctomycetes bacterium Pla86]